MRVGSDNYNYGACVTMTTTKKVAAPVVMWLWGYEPRPPQVHHRRHNKLRHTAGAVELKGRQEGIYTAYYTTSGAGDQAEIGLGPWGGMPNSSGR